MVRALSLCALVALSACKKDPGEEDQGPLDVRIDGAGEDDGVDSTATRMCTNADGKVFVTWSDDRDGASAIFANASVDAGRSWMPGASRVSNGAKSSIAPAIACTADNVYIVWEDNRDGELENHNIYFSRSTDFGATWSEEIALDLDDEGSHMSLGPQIAAVGSDVYVGWFDARNGAYDVYVAASHDGGESFGEPRRVDSDEKGAAYSAWPRIAAESGGIVHVAWEDSRDGSSDIYFSSSANGGRDWGDDVRLDGGEERGLSNSFEPRLSAADGLVYVVWHDERNGEGRDVYMNWSSDYGETFAGEAIAIETGSPGFYDSLYPEVVVHAGIAHITWQDARNVGFDVYYRKAEDGEFAKEEQRLDTDTAGFANSLFPKITANDNGIAVAWQDRRDDVGGEGYDDLYYNFSRDGGATWAPADLRIDRVQSGSKYAHDLNVTLFRQELFTAWTDGRNGSGDVFFHALQLGEESPVVVAGAEE